MTMKIIASVLGLIYGIYLSYLRMQKHKRINSQGTATVKEVRKLGRDDGSKSYAIFYDVVPACQNDEHVLESFELCRTPVRRCEKIGKVKTIYFEKDNQKNYYFKSVGKLDNRLIFPFILLICDVFLWITVILQLF